MRPFTKAVFEREGKSIVGSRWTLEQVQQAYERADLLLDYIAACKEASKPLKRAGLEMTHSPDFENGLETRLAKKKLDKGVQALTLGVLKKLLGRGLDVLSEAARVYRNSPETFKELYASSKPAFLKDRSSQQKVPTNSFSAFKTGDNPAISSDEQLSLQYTIVYQYFNPKKWAKNDLYLTWLWHTDAGRRCRQETRWLQSVAEDIFQKKLGTPAQGPEPIIPPPAQRQPNR